MDINFTGQMQAIPAAAKGLIVKVDRIIDHEQAEFIGNYVRAKLGGDIKVVVTGPELTFTAVE